MTMNNPAWLGQLLRNGTIKQPDIAYAHVAPLYRAVELRADALSSVPYRLMRNGVEVEWPWKKNFSRLIASTERSLLVTGAAYWVRIVKGRTLTGFEALNPTTVNYRYDPNMGTLENPYLGLSFNQVIGGKMYGPWTLEQIVYFRENSFIDDVGPGLAPAQVAMQNAQLSYNLDRFTSMFFEGGAQPVTVMNLPDSMDDSEFKRMGAEINQRGSGVLNAFKWIFVRAQELKVQKITPDINTLMMPELADRTLKQIAMTMGVPLTMLEASAANYATADSDRQSFWRETVIPRLPKLADVLNEQLLGPLNYEIQFMPEQLDVMQADEAQRAGSLLQLTQAGVPLRAAMQILGYDNIADIVLPGDLASPESTPVEAPTDEGTVAPEGMTATTKAVANEWALLSKKIERRIKSGRDPRTSFDSALIPADHVDAVMAHCYKGMTVADVHDVIHAVKAPVDDMTPDELRIYNRIIKEMRKKGEQWARDIVNERNPETSLRDVIKPVLDSELGTTMGKRIDRLGTQFSIPMDTGDQSRYIQDWLLDYTPRETAKIDETTANRIKPIIEMFRTTPGMTIQDVAAAVAPLSDPMRAKMIAITETTRAASQATTSYQDYLRERGVNMVKVWNTDADELVCDICTGRVYGVKLNGLTEDQWPPELAAGPPAHVNCRCDTTLLLVR